MTIQELVGHLFFQLSVLYVVLLSSVEGQHSDVKDRQCSSITLSHKLKADSDVLDNSAHYR
jgi:hypothetical protein